MRRQREAEVIYAILFCKTSFLTYFSSHEDSALKNANGKHSKADI